MEQNEQLRSPETLSTQQPEHRSPSHSLASAQAEKVFVERKEMLAEIVDELNPSLRDQLTKKIEAEFQALAAFIDVDARVIEAKKKSVKVLDPTFFVQKPLDTSHF
jgi:hypothetical protein